MKRNHVVQGVSQEERDFDAAVLNSLATDLQEQIRRLFQEMDEDAFVFYK